MEIPTVLLLTQPREIPFWDNLLAAPPVPTADCRGRTQANSLPDSVTTYFFQLS